MIFFEVMSQGSISILLDITNVLVDPDTKLTLYFPYIGFPTIVFDDVQHMCATVIKLLDFILLVGVRVSKHIFTNFTMTNTGTSPLFLRNW